MIDKKPSKIPVRPRGEAPGKIDIEGRQAQDVNLPSSGPTTGDLIRNYRQSTEQAGGDASRIAANAKASVQPPTIASQIRPSQPFQGRMYNSPATPITKAYGIPSYDEGTDYVPEDQVAQLHQGESVIPAAQNPNNPANQTQMQMPLPQAQPQPNVDSLPARSLPQQGVTPDVKGPAPVKHSVFDMILNKMAGGPRYTTDPNTGVKSEVPASSRVSLSGHVLAGAISAMLSGWAAGEAAPAGPAGTRGPANAAAANAAANSVQQSQAAFRNAPQQQLDQQMVRRAGAIKNTTDELRNQMMADKLHEDDWSRKENFYTKTQDTWQPVIDTIKSTEKNSHQQLIFASGLTSDQTMEKMKGNAGNYSPIQDGWVTETHADGRVYHLPTFALIKNGTVTVDRDTLLALSPFNSSVKDLLEKNSADNVPLSSTMLISLEKQAGLAHGTYEAIHQWQVGLGVPAESQISQSVFNERFRSNPALQRQAGDLGTALSNVGTQSTAHALQQLQASGRADQIFKLIGKSPDEITKYVNDQKNRETEAAAHAAGASKEEIATETAASREKIAAGKAAGKAKAGESPSNFADFRTPDALGFQPQANKFAGTEKEAIKQYNKVKGPFKKNADDLAKMEGTYQQFNDILRDANSGKDLTGAQSVVALFNAIGISAEPLAGKGFRINNNTVQEHTQARGLDQSLYQKLLKLKDGDVITPQQVKDYASIAVQTRQNKYVNLVNEAHNQGLNADFVLPTGNGEKIDPSTAKIFMQLAGGNAAKARQIATAKGWNF